MVTRQRGRTKPSSRTATATGMTGSGSTGPHDPRPPSTGTCPHVCKTATRTSAVRSSEAPAVKAPHICIPHARVSPLEALCATIVQIASQLGRAWIAQRLGRQCGTAGLGLDVVDSRQRSQAEDRNAMCAVKSLINIRS